MQIPPRPNELKLDGVEPCTLFTTAQLDQLRIDREPRSRAVASGHYQGLQECVLGVQRTEPSLDYGVLLVTKEGIEPWLTGKRNVDAWLVSVGGYPAASFVLRGGGDRGDQPGARCTTAVGVAEGQQLYVTISPSAKRELTQNQLCQLTEQAAGMALQTLQTLR